MQAVNAFMQAIEAFMQAINAFMHFVNAFMQVARPTGVVWDLQYTLYTLLMLTGERLCQNSTI